MLCFNCNNKAICKHYNYIINNTDVTLEVKTCSHLKQESRVDFASINTYDNMTDIKIKSAEIKPVIPTTTTIPIIETKKTKEYINVNQMFPDEFKDVISDFKVTKEPTPLVTCDGCSDKVYEEDKLTCSKCEASICISCGYTVVSDDGIGLTTVCGDCFSTVEDASNVSNITTLFDNNTDINHNDKFWEELVHETE